MGDIRSRLIRLIPSAPTGSPLDCIRRLLEYRLPGGVNTTNVAVKQEWGDIVEGTHRLWRVSRGSSSSKTRSFAVASADRVAVASADRVAVSPR